MATLPQLARLGTGRPLRLCCACPYRLEGQESILTSSMPRPPPDWAVVASGVGTRVWDTALIGVGAVFGTQAPPACYPRGLLGWCSNWSHRHWSPKPRSCPGRLVLELIQESAEGLEQGSLGAQWKGPPRVETLADPGRTRGSVGPHLFLGRPVCDLAPEKAGIRGGGGPLPSSSHPPGRPLPGDPTHRWGLQKGLCL